MVDAQMTVNKDDAFIGSAHSKIDPVLDQMLRNYPKVDMGKVEKTAGNK
jgi:hypothetical protein